MSATGGVQITSPGSAFLPIQVNASSGIVANAVATATLPATAGKFTWLTGFSVSAAGSTAGAVVDVTVTGMANVEHYTFVFPAGATTAAQPLVVELATPLKSSAINTAIVVSCPAGGAGNTNTTVNAHGYVD